MKVPADLRKKLAAVSGARTAWEGLTSIARRDFINWIESAKQPQTRLRRVEKAADMLIHGKRRPCCYAVVPLSVYSALGANPKAKAQWKLLTPDERRNVVGWIFSVSEKDAEAHRRRMQKACAMLAAGKRRF